MQKHAQHSFHSLLNEQNDKHVIGEHFDKDRDNLCLIYLQER